MMLQPLLQYAEQLKKLDLMSVANVSEPQFYSVRERWFSSDDQIPNAEKNGLYLYVSTKDEVWYIGKGEYANGGGIGYRSCSHLGEPHRHQESLFPYHEWADDESVEPSIRASLSRGLFKIVTIAGTPSFYSSLIEVFLQTAYFKTHQRLPPLNKRIG